MTDPLARCAVHDEMNCAICSPPPRTYSRGLVAIDAPPGHFVEVRPGKGVYHYPDCQMVTADWEGADQAKLGRRLVHSPNEIRALGLRSAECCQPPTIR